MRSAGILIITALSLFAAGRGVAADTLWTGPYSQTFPSQSGTVSCTEPTPSTFTCTFLPPLLPPLPIPVIASAMFNVAAPIVNDELIGTLDISNGPIAVLKIIGGDMGNPTTDPPGYFNVWPATLHLRITGVDGAVLPPSGIYFLVVSATNSSGVTSEPAIIMVIVP